MRELIGLVLAFAISGAFLAWMDPMARSDTVVFAIWNGLLAMYLGFAFLQAWARSVLRWVRTGDGDPPGRRPRRWTALGVAEATVIGGTMLCCTQPLFGLAGIGRAHSPDLTVPIAILLLGSAAAFLVLRKWRTEPGDSLTARKAQSTIEERAKIERRETS
jgi:hypothetical protein